MLFPYVLTDWLRVHVQAPAVSLACNCSFLSPFHALYVCMSFPGMPTENKEQVEAAARKVQEKGVDAVLAKLGTKGSMLIQKDEVLNQSILKADKVSFHQLPITWVL